MPDAGVPDVDGAGRTGRPDLAAHVLVDGDFRGAHVAEVRAGHQKGAAHFVGRVGGKERELDIKVVLAKIDDRILMGVGAAQLAGRR